MAIRMSDGTVVPSHIEVGSSDERSLVARDHVSGNFALRVGYITAVHKPGDKGYEDQKFTTYDVICPQVDGFGAETLLPYWKCRLLHAFGSLADHSTHTLRAPAKYQGKLDKDFLSQTTKVLLLCANGRSSSPYIIGCDNHPSLDKDDSEQTRFAHWSFNGVDVEIDNDGALDLVVNGATKANGDPDGRDSNQKGSTVSFAKDGTIEIKDQNGQTITISSKDKKITIDSGAIDSTTQDDWTLQVGGDQTVKVDGDSSLNADGNLQIKGDKTYIGSQQASENLVLGQQLVAALGAFVDIWVNNAATLGLSAVGPVTLFPQIIAQLEAWKLQYATNLGPEPAQILASDKFTER